MVGIVFVFLLIAAILLIELRGIQFHYTTRELELLPQEYVVTKAEAYQKQAITSLVIWNSEEDNSRLAKSEFEQIFLDMKIRYDLVDVTCHEIPDYAAYETVVVLLNDLEPMGESLLALCDWVYAGGSAMLPVTLLKTPYNTMLAGALGIMTMTYDTMIVDTLYVAPDFMVGGGKAFHIEDGYDSAWHIELDCERTTVYMSTAEANGLPLVWRADHGDGVFVVDNFGLYEKSMRGFFAASYSLLCDVGIYPVINGSTFYLDDFPSQIPMGDSEYIQRDYGVSIRDFYMNIWWQDMMNLSDRYGLKYTGLAIECYDDAVDGSTETQPDKETFLTFGNMLLRRGGEIGYHGYNHQPLCLGDCDYKGIFDYKTWESYDAMKLAFDELVDFCDELFPDVTMDIYVPPSNILSEKGREFLLKEYPEIRTISGIYFEDSESEYSCVQEFDVDENGIVDQPRIISGCELTPYMEIAAISELNFHFVNNHFTHPDDALDPDRGAELGWEALSAAFEEFLDWLYTSAPSLRNLTGSEMSAAVQRFASVSFDKEITEQSMTIRLNDFYDEASFMVRFNEKEPGEVTGGTLTKLTGDLYLLTATAQTVTIALN